MLGYVVAAIIGIVVGGVGLALWWMWQEAGQSRASVDHGPDRLSRWEETALLATGAASAFNVLLWALGYTLVDATPEWTALGVLRVAFAVLSFVSMDLVVIVTVMAMRAGRRGFWSELCSIVAALAAAGIALEVAGVVTWPWLHAAPMVVLYTFMRHLAAPKAGQRAKDVVRERDALVLEVAQVRTANEAAVQERATAGQEVRRAWDTVEELRAELAQVQGDVDHWRSMAAQGAARPALSDDHETVTIGTKQVSLRALAQALELPKTSLGRAVDRAAQKGGSNASHLS